MQLVRIILQERFPTKQEAEMKRMVTAIKEGTIDEWIMHKILNKMYDEEDKQVILQMIQEQHEYRTAILMDIHQREVAEYNQIAEARADLSPDRR